MQSRNFVIVAAVLALVGLVVNVGLDLDNAYDMTTATLWVVTLIFALLGAFVGRKS